MTTTTETKTTSVKLNEVAPPRVTVRCHDCGTVTRVYRVEPVTQVGSFRFCAVCGSQHVSAFMSAETDQWEALARDYGLPVDVIRQLYALWEPHKHYRFADFVAELRAEIAAGTYKPPAPKPLPASKPASVLPRMKVPSRV